MPTEDDLRDMFAAAEPPQRIHADRVIARSRARRRPRQVLVGAVGALAVAGLVVVSLPALFPQHSAISTLSQAGGSAAEPNVQAFDSKRAPADRINLCTGPLAEPAPSPSGLRLDVAFPATAAVGSDAIQGTVRLTNTGADPVSGSTAAPAITLSQGGIVLWHSTGAAAEAARPVELAPGQSMEFAASFTPVRCGVQDDEAAAFRADLPAVPAGEYSLSAALDFMPAASTPVMSTPGADVVGVELVTGPLSPITLH